MTYFTCAIHPKFLDVARFVSSCAMLLMVCHVVYAFFLVYYTTPSLLPLPNNFLELPLISSYIEPFRQQFDFVSLLCHYAATNKEQCYRASCLSPRNIPRKCQSWTRATISPECEQFVATLDLRFCLDFLELAESLIFCHEKFKPNVATEMINEE